MKEFQEIYNTLLKSLIEYLCVYNQLLIPGIGTFSLENQADTFNNNEAENILDISMETILFSRKFEYKNYQLFNFLSKKLELSEEDAKKTLYHFSFYIQTEIENNNYYNLNEIGELKSHLGQITLIQKPKKIVASAIDLSINEAIDVKTISPAEFVLANREYLTREYEIYKGTNENLLNFQHVQIEETSLQNIAYPAKKKILIVKNVLYIIIVLVSILAIFECYLYLLLGKYI